MRREFIISYKKRKRSHKACIYNLKPKRIRGFKKVIPEERPYFCLVKPSFKLMENSIVYDFQ